MTTTKQFGCQHPSVRIFYKLFAPGYNFSLCWQICNMPSSPYEFSTSLDYAHGSCFCIKILLCFVQSPTAKHSSMTLSPPQLNATASCQDGQTLLGLPIHPSWEQKESSWEKPKQFHQQYFEYNGHPTPNMVMDIVSYSNPDGWLTNSDMEMASLQFLWLVIEGICGYIDEAHVALFSNNSPTVQLALKHVGVVMQLVRALTLCLWMKWASPLLPMYIAGIDNSMADIPSCSFGL